MNSPPQPLLVHQIASILLIAVFLAFAGLMGTWLFSREWQEKTIAAGLMGLPLLLAWAQYQATFRRNRAAAKVAAILSTLVAALAILFCLISWSLLLRFSHPLTNALLYTLVAASFVVVSYQNLIWLQTLTQAAAENRLPASPHNITLKEIFFLIAATALTLAATSYGVHQNWHYTLLF